MIVNVARGDTMDSSVIKKKRISGKKGMAVKILSIVLAISMLSIFSSLQAPKVRDILNTNGEKSCVETTVYGRERQDNEVHEKLKEPVFIPTKYKKQYLNGVVDEFDPNDPNPSTRSDFKGHPLEADEKTLNDGVGDYTLKYGYQDTRTTNPRIIAVMASPPYVEGLNGGDNTAVGYGTSTSESSSKTSQISASAGVSVGYEASASFFGLFETGIEVEASITASFGWSWTTTKTTSEGVVYTGESDDYVVYQTVLYDEYVYQVIDHYDPDIIGLNISIGIPSTPKILATTLDTFNSINGDGLDIGAETFRHQPGKPHTYPTESDAAEILKKYPGMKSKNEITTGEGAGQTIVEIDIEEETSTGSSWDISVEMSVKVKAGGATAGVTAGFGYGESYEITVGEGTHYEASIAHLPDLDSWKEHKYSTGMFIYNFIRPDGWGYQVMNFYVKDYHGKEVFDYEGDLMAYWECEPPAKDTTGNLLQETSGNQMVCGLYGMPVYAAGKTGKGLYFDGFDDYAFLPGEIPNYDYSISLWFKTDNTSTGLLSVRRGKLGQNNFDRNLFLVGGRLTYRIWNGGEFLTQTPEGASYSDGTWHHVVVSVQKGVGCRLYVDGELKASSKIEEGGTDESSEYGGEVLHFGYAAGMSKQQEAYVDPEYGDTLYRDVTIDYYNGSMDEMLFYTRVLNLSEIGELAKAAPPKKEIINPGAVAEKEEEKQGFPYWMLLVVIVVIIIIIVVLVRAKNTKKKGGRKKGGKKKSKK